MKIDNLNVFGLSESIVASGLPMVLDYNEMDFEEEADKVLSMSNHVENNEVAEKHIRRAKSLASCKGGESHDCFLCGIIVQMNVTAPRMWWPEFQRYHFADIVSSTSTMHRLKNFVEKYDEFETSGQYDKLYSFVADHFDINTNPDVIKQFYEVAKRWQLVDSMDIKKLKANLPEGWLQTARITTNYRQLKTMIAQRRHHRLQDWRDFCETLIDALPMPELLIAR